MRTALIITTYNRPDALGLVLDSVARQTIMPDEVIVADDGSGEETAAVIARKREEHRLPLLHKWQQDDGFRAARVRNLGVSTTSADYLVFIDGDILLHPEFIRSHLAHCKPGRLLHGARVLISDDCAKRITDEGKLVRFHIFEAGIRSRLNMIHNLPLSRIFSTKQTRWSSHGCNLSLYKDDFVRVNGFNEDFTGWGKEDSELVLRMMRNGVEKFNLRCCAVAYHLGHGWSNERRYGKELEENALRLDDIVAGGTIRCANGLDNHLAAAKLDHRAEQ